MPSNVISFDSLRSVAFGSITNSYTALGNPYTHNLRSFRIVNTTNADMLFSFDTINNNIIVPAGGFVLYDVTTNRENNTTTFVFRANTQFYIKYVSAPSSGTVYIEAFYGMGE